MNENKMCNYCKKPTADEIVKGDIFCIECGRQRDMLAPSAQVKEDKTKKRKEWWKSAGGVVMLIVALAFGQAMVKTFITPRPADMEKVKRVTQNKVAGNMLKLSDESLQQFTDLTRKAHTAITNNLEGQDRDDFLRIADEGPKMTPDEGLRLTQLVEKSKISMSAEDRETVERFQQQAKQLMK